MGKLILRFSSDSPRFSVCEDHISFHGRGCILGPRYLEEKVNQWVKYESHDVKAPFLFKNPKGISWGNWIKFLPRFYPKTEIKGCEMK
ncbi:hypothetical protein Pyn_34236 [Prunus yedoensis var. nudiflora]|uniref:Uncharacterized protein n=1 Tax=Prunus yedoensis var. nudiflora TaxID=2094558 RepID=A0A314Z7Z1_PRUYE|nr:hypothetical protein Pyn_34236 [Prunus yedoensis var. nudiflora]